MRRYFDTGLMAMLGLLVALIVGRRAFEAGFDHHLTKPADFTALARLLHEARRAPKETLHA